MRCETGNKIERVGVPVCGLCLSDAPHPLDDCTNIRHMRNSGVASAVLHSFP